MVCVSWLSKYWLTEWINKLLNVIIPQPTCPPNSREGGKTFVWSLWSPTLSLILRQSTSLSFHKWSREAARSTTVLGLFQVHWLLYTLEWEWAVFQWSPVPILWNTWPSDVEHLTLGFYSWLWRPSQNPDRTSYQHGVTHSSIQPHLQEVLT